MHICSSAFHEELNCEGRKEMNLWNPFIPFHLIEIESIRGQNTKKTFSSSFCVCVCWCGSGMGTLGHNINVSSSHGINTLVITSVTVSLSRLTKQRSITALNTLTHGQTCAAVDVCKQTQCITNPFNRIKRIKYSFYLLLKLAPEALFHKGRGTQCSKHSLTSS